MAGCSPGFSTTAHPSSIRQRDLRKNEFLPLTTNFSIAQQIRGVFQFNFGSTGVLRNRCFISKLSFLEGTGKGCACWLWWRPAHPENKSATASLSLYICEVFVNRTFPEKHSQADEKAIKEANICRTFLKLYIYSKKLFLVEMGRSSWRGTAIFATGNKTYGYTLQKCV